MSLDSVELLVSFENYFEVSIPNEEAERIGTLQDAVDHFSAHLGITSTHTGLKEDIFTSLKHTLSEAGLCKREISLQEHVKSVFSNDPETWGMISQKSTYLIPAFPVKQEERFFQKWLPGISWQSLATFGELTFHQLVDVICAANYQTLLNGKNLNSTYEVYIAVMAITSYSSGVDLYDLSPEKSFTNDLGID